MFALWYLTLAIDELRKYLGWNSFSDIFNINKTAKQNALDDKPSVNKKIVPEPKVPEKAPEKEPEKKPEPIVTKPTPAPTPTPTPTPTPKLPSVPSAPKTPEIKPEVTKPDPPKAEQPKQISQSAPDAVTVSIEPKAPEIPKASENLPTTPTTTPATVPTLISTPQPTRQSISPSRNEPNDLDKKLFSPPKNLENGEAPKSNIKDATSSFLAGEGQASNLKRSES